jgi:hypothetical protein
VSATFTTDKLGMLLGDRDRFGFSNGVAGEGGGVEIKSLMPGGPAMLLGLKVGDVVHSVNGFVLERASEDQKAVRDLVASAPRPCTVVVARWVPLGSGAGGASSLGGSGGPAFVKHKRGVPEFDVAIDSAELGFKVALGPFLHPGATHPELGYLVVWSVDKTSSAVKQGMRVGNAVVGLNGVRWPQRGTPSPAAFADLCSKAARPLVLHLAKRRDGDDDDDGDDNNEDEGKDEDELAWLRLKCPKAKRRSALAVAASRSRFGRVRTLSAASLESIGEDREKEDLGRLDPLPLGRLSRCWTSGGHARTSFSAPES